MREAQQVFLLIDVSRETIRALQEMRLRRFLDCMALDVESSLRVGTVATVLAGRWSGHCCHLWGMSGLEVLGLLVWLRSVQVWGVRRGVGAGSGLRLVCGVCPLEVGEGVCA